MCWVSTLKNTADADVEEDDSDEEVYFASLC